MQFSKLVRMMSKALQMEERAITHFDVFGEELPPQSYSGKNVGEETALKFSVVWAASTLITDAVSNLNPEATTENVDKSGKIQVSPATLPAWVRKPHPEQRRSLIWGQMLMSLLLWGNCYCLLTRRESDAQINGMMVLAPNTVQCEWDPERPNMKRYRVSNSPRWLTSKDIMHIQGATLPGKPTGLSVIAQARESIGLGLTLEEFASRYFGQGSMAKVVIKSKKQLDPKAARELVNTYERFHRGPGNWHRPAVLSGDGEIQNISIPPEDAQFLESRDFQALDVARWFRVPPHRVGIVSKSSSWGSGLSEENTAVVQNTYRPWILRMEEALTAYSPGGEDSGLKIRLNDAILLRGSFKEQVDAYAAGVAGQIITPNEARKGLGFDPIKGGDELVKPPAPAAPGQKPGEKPAAKKESDDAAKEKDRDRKQEEANS